MIVNDSAEIGRQGGPHQLGIGFTLAGMECSPTGPYARLAVTIVPVNRLVPRRCTNFLLMPLSWRSSPLCLFCELCDREDGNVPRRHVQVQSARLQIATISVIDGIAHLILQLPLVIIQVRERQPDIALALVRSVVHRDKQPRGAKLDS